MCATLQSFDWVTAVRSIWSSIPRTLTNPDREEESAPEPSITEELLRCGILCGGRSRFVNVVGSHDRGRPVSLQWE
jgi:hypothetical protein